MSVKNVKASTTAIPAKSHETPTTAKAAATSVAQKARATAPPFKGQAAAREWVKPAGSPGQKAVVSSLDRANGNRQFGAQQELGLITNFETKMSKLQGRLGADEKVVTISFAGYKDRAVPPLVDENGKATPANASIDLSDVLTSIVSPKDTNFFEILMRKISEKALGLGIRLSPDEAKQIALNAISSQINSVLGQFNS